LRRREILLRAEEGRGKRGFRWWRARGRGFEQARARLDSSFLLAHSFLGLLTSRRRARQPRSGLGWWRWGPAAPAGCLSKEARRFTRKSLWPTERVGAGPSFSWGRRRPCRVSVYYVTVAPRCAFPSHPSHASPLCCWIRSFPCLPGPAWLSSPTHPQLARAVGPFRFIISVADLFAQSPNVVGGASAWYVAS
jgi:hypothetical protein